MKEYTDVEQSKKLLELGLNPESADMVYLKYSDTDNPTPRFEGAAPMILMDIPIYEVDCETLACWSLGALLELLRRYDDCNKLDIFSNRSQKWQITISYYDCVWKEHDEININLFEAVYSMVVWLLENNYFKR